MGQRISGHYKQETEKKGNIGGAADDSMVYHFSRPSNRKPEEIDYTPVKGGDIIKQVGIGTTKVLPTIESLKGWATLT
jgi:hypothetical protein